MLPKAIKQFKNMHAIKIQKFMKGYLVFTKDLLVMKKEKLYGNQVFFDSMRDALVLRAIGTIKVFWRRYKIRKNRQREIEEENKLKSAKKKGGKKVMKKG